MTPCPNCNDIWVYKKDDVHQYKANCRCGYAWYWSSFVPSKGQAKANWESYMEAYYRNQMKEPKE